MKSSAEKRAEKTVKKVSTPVPASSVEQWLTNALLRLASEASIKWRRSTISQFGRAQSRGFRCNWIHGRSWDTVFTVFVGLYRLLVCGGVLRRSVFPLALPAISQRLIVWQMLVSSLAVRWGRCLCRLGWIGLVVRCCFGGGTESSSRGIQVTSKARLATVLVVRADSLGASSSLCGAG